MMNDELKETLFNSSFIIPHSSFAFLAERVGFEPTVRFPVHSISSAASSATPAPLLKKAKGKSQTTIRLFTFTLNTFSRQSIAYPQDCCHAAAPITRQP